MTATVTVDAGARLHFGLLSLGPDKGGFFGGLGMSIQSPRFVVHARVAECESFIGSQWVVERAKRTLDRLREHDLLSSRVVFELTYEEEIPQHHGLGSGTQLSLATARAVLELQNNGSINTVDLAEKLGRGQRSAIGIHAFDHGGMILDGGKVHVEDIGELRTRVDVPESWRMLLINPPEDKGVSDEHEKTAFQKLAPPDMGTTERLLELANECIAAVRLKNFVEFRSLLNSYGELVGSYFAPVQGGIFSHPFVEKLNLFLDKLGHPARPVQSSWGPTVCLPCESEAEAVELKGLVQTELQFQNYHSLITTARNQGAVIRHVHS
ncbi:GHMP family kinase ATP-binding protein [Calycomorphotria hydatis]|uniref:GHMP kinase N-terminal domain-containing protein n=1 Tax=Calycomorphotria hydatis TaxID=2528027 RepID=A0A517TAF6_9PLAN|nr:hypothetical protein [Calycomorphotria hydatis]QDT65358.1 hypothetical protein V22_26110 [Calycomorphotria hydatis]